MHAGYNLRTWGFFNNLYYSYPNVSKCFTFWTIKQYFAQVEMLVQVPSNKKADLKYAFWAFIFFVPLKHESLLAGTVRLSRAHKWYSVLTGYASVNDLYINKESMTDWFWIWSPGLNPLQALALTIPDC